MTVEPPGTSFLSRAGIRRDPSSVLRRVAALIPAAAPPFVLYLISPLAPLTDETAFSSVAEKAEQLVFPFANYVLWLDVTTACAVTLLLLACLATRRCSSTQAGGLAVALTALLFLAVPFAFKGTYFFDTRFVIMFGFLLFGALLLYGLPRLAAVAFTLLFAVRWPWCSSCGGNIAAIWPRCARSSPSRGRTTACSSPRCRRTRHRFTGRTDR